MTNQIIKSESKNFENRIYNIQNIIQKTILSSQKYKVYDIIGTNELNMCITTLETIFKDSAILLQHIINNNNSEKNILTKIQSIESELLIIFKNFGSDTMKDVLSLLVGTDYIKEQLMNTYLLDKFNIINKCVHPINYKSMIWKNDNDMPNKKVIQKNRIVEDHMILEAENLECFDLARTSKSFQTKVYGIKVCIQDYKNKKTYIIACIVDDILLSCFNSQFIQTGLCSLNIEKPKEIDYNIEQWDRFVSSLTLKELLVYNNAEIYTKFQGTINQLSLMKQKTISQLVKEFINSELYVQRTILIQLLIKYNEHEFQYLAYLLYDLLSTENNGNVDTLEQTLLYDSLPWNIKKYFRNAMKQTIQYTNTLYNFDNNKIPLEQQICLLKATDNVKEKAILKLKEIKAKSEDSGTKARQYLDGLLKIPFCIFKEEYILTITNETQNIFKNISNKINNNIIYNNNIILNEKDKYTNIEMVYYCKNIKNNYIPQIITNTTDTLVNDIVCFKKEHLLSIYTYIKYFIK